jgi:hypothetical protein
MGGHLGGGGRVVVGQQVRVVGRMRPQGQQLPAAGIDGHHGPVAGAELVAGEALQVGPQRQAQVPDPLPVHEQVAQAADLQVEGPAGELVVVGALEPGGSQGEAVVTGDVGEQLALRVAALQVEAAGAGHGVGDDHAVGGGDGAPGLVEVPQDGPGVLRVPVQLVGLEHREPVELREQHHEAAQQAGAQPSDLAGHRTSSGSRSASRSALSWLIRSSSATRM